MKMQIFIEPEDVWLFRDGKPFDAGSDHRARSLFPPYPNVMQGIIRSHQIILQGIRLNDKKKILDEIGTATEYGNFSMRGLFIAKLNSNGLTTYFPVPADATPFSDTQLKSAPPKKPANGVLTSHGDILPSLCFASGNPNKQEYGAWLDYHNLLKCLRGDTVIPTSEKELFQRESRFGIEIEADRRRVTKEGQLYQAEFIRPCPNVGLYVEFDGYKSKSEDEKGWLDSGLLRMGGEGHAGRYQRVSPFELPKPGEKLTHFKVYFASPAFFSKGWKPEKWDDFFKGDIALEAVALKGYETIGGYDVASNRQKAALRFVPAGSVYYFSSKSGAKLKKEAITDMLPGNNDIAKIGFGQVIVMETKEER